MAVNLKQNADGTTSLHSESLGKSVLKLGGQEQPIAGSGNLTPGQPSTFTYHGSSYMKIAIGTLAGTSGAGAVLNPEPNDLIVGNTMVNVTAGASAVSAFLSIGVGGASISAYSANLLDHCLVNNAGVYNNNDDKGALGKSRQIWSQNTYLTMTCGVTPNTLAGYVYVELMNP